MRLFTAIEISADVKDRLRALLDRLRPTVKPGMLNWTRVDNLHITTKFIGEWPEARLDELKRTLESVRSPGEIARVGSPGEPERSRSQGYIDVHISGLGWFPNDRRPRVLWAGVRKSEPLNALAHATEEAVRAIGVAREIDSRESRDYSPHLTLARIRERVPEEALGRLRGAIDSLESTQFGSFRATDFHLYLSAGGRYTRLAQFGLI